MWIPKDYQEIVQAVTGGNLQETEIFDVKSEVPKQKPNKELAKDVAAMANDGGVLLYGVDEDQNGQPTVLAPITLVGESERISQVVDTAIAEPPKIIIHEYENPQNSTEGFLVVIVPPSPRAPHMVIAGGDNRYYRRSGKTTASMSEGDVARLYERRRRWERDVKDLVVRELKRLPYIASEEHGYLYIFAWPVTSDGDLFDRARKGKSWETTANEIVEATINSDVFRKRFYPDIQYNVQWQFQTDGLRAYMAHDPRTRSNREPDHILDVQLNFDGSGWLVCGRATVNTGPERGLVFIEDLVAGLTTKFVYMMGELYNRASYVGQVDFGATVTSVQGASSYYLHNRSLVYENPPSFGQPDYLKTTRTSTLEMTTDPISVAKTLLKNLIDALTQKRYDPFT